MIDPHSEHPKPCIALMGEFSAGKSTLANLLIGSDPLPVQVIATQLPPVWISHGQDAPYRVDLEGEHIPVDIHNLAGVPLESTSYIRIFCEEDILLQCDLLDMPGISDPNMSPDIWQRMMNKADGVIWCSHATQAWRQSEAAVWGEMDRDLYARSILLLTRIDKLVTEQDRARVLKRVKRETEGLFSACLPISLLQATREQDDYEVWSKSGAGEFAQHLAALLDELQSDMGSPSNEGKGSQNETDLSLPAFAPPAHLEQDVQPKSTDAPQIVPRRILAGGNSRQQTARP